MNWRGCYTLWRKEVWRFLKVTVQILLTPVVTALLYLLIFSHVLGERVEVYPVVGYGAFLIPGLIMMSMIQNAFANSSSSLIQSKMVGNLVFCCWRRFPPWSSMWRLSPPPRCAG